MKEEYQEILKKALEDEVVRSLKVLSPEYIPLIEQVLNEHKKDFYLGEWRSELGRIHYDYLIHSPETALKLMQLKKKGYRWAKPRLVRLYSREELEKYVKKVA